MNKRHYQLLALAILIGAPLLVSALTGLIPRDGSAAGNEAEPARPDYLAPAANPIAGLEVKPLPEPPTQPPPSYAPPATLAGGATLDPTPTLDPSAMASAPVGGVDPAAPPQVVATAPSVPPPLPQPALAGPLMAQQGALPPRMIPKFREGPLLP